MRRYSPKLELQPKVVVDTLHTASLDWESWLRQMLGQMDGQGAPEDLAEQNNDGAQVIFDVCLDGARYTLTRSCLHPAQVSINLSPREKEIVRLIARGLPNKAISDVLEISPWTVATHLRRIFVKLGVSCRAEMVARVLEEGLLGNL